SDPSTGGPGSAPASFTHLPLQCVVQLACDGIERKLPEAGIWHAECSGCDGGDHHGPLGERESHRHFNLAPWVELFPHPQIICGWPDFADSALQPIQKVLDPIQKVLGITHHVPSSSSKLPEAHTPAKTM